MKENSIEEQKIQKATNNILRGEDIESAVYILKKFMFDNVIFIRGRVNPVKIATRQVLNFIKRYQASDYETICLKNNEMEEIVDKIQVEYNNLLKENEYMHKQLDKQQTTINKYAKENEELKEDRKNNNEMIALAQNEILNYMSGYEEGKKHKMTAVAQVVENQQYYIVRKQMEKYEEHIKRLQKENEELKERIREHTLLISPYYVKENFIPVQKVKEKIEYLDNQQKQWLEDRKLKASDSEIIFSRDILQKLLESEE